MNDVFGIVIVKQVYSKHLHRGLDRLECIYYNRLSELNKPILLVCSIRTKYIEGIFSCRKSVASQRLQDL